VNLYIAYYRSQRKGQSAHSPRTCIPGGGWEITALEERKIDSARPGDPLTVNRAVIQRGTDKQVVYYWFQQRGRILTNEYLVKFYLFWDALTKNRTDGALVRLTAPVSKGENESDADRLLGDFAKEIRPLLVSYIPH
jgi:EpsI family protein